jgi:hypothetical protein
MQGLLDRVDRAVHPAALEEPPRSDAVANAVAHATRTFVLATVTVPIVGCGLMPQGHMARVRLLARTAHP